ncbi:hypothetical protein FRX31_015589 [Thalictrum thalictroides]|uniref:Uncharacterized protein n=1 Tax=Thalictrum thalictroides TaxID=46969 RepID=A0A7J6WCX1_THATH|nr:hypothetical protein FRX31_015589 [Thalictrum thalictroides]
MMEKNHGFALHTGVIDDAISISVVQVFCWCFPLTYNTSTFDSCFIKYQLENLIVIKQVQRKVVETQAFLWRFLWR